MATFPRFPIWTDAYLGDTMHLSLEEHGAYLKLLIIAWRSPNRRLPDNDQRIATMLGVTVGRWRDKLRPVIAPFWKIENGWWRQKRLEKEWQAVEDYSEKQRERAEARWRAKSLDDKEPEHAAGYATADAAGYATSPSPSPKSKDSSISPDLSPAGDAQDIPSKMVEIWNEELGGILPKPRKIDKSRRTALASRFREDFEQDLEVWRGFCQKVRRCPHLIGVNDRSWKADIDFCLIPKKINRILEGVYDAAPNGNGHMRQRQAAPRTTRDSSHAFTDLLNVGTTDEQS